MSDGVCTHAAHFDALCQTLSGLSFPVCRVSDILSVVCLLSLVCPFFVCALLLSSVCPSCFCLSSICPSLCVCPRLSVAVRVCLRLSTSVHVSLFLCPVCVCGDLRPRRANQVNFWWRLVSILPSKSFPVLSWLCLSCVCVSLCLSVRLSVCLPLCLEAFFHFCFSFIIF